MKEFYAAIVAIITIISGILAVLTGVGFITNMENMTALFIFVPSIIIAIVGLLKCYRTPSYREWLFGWLFPW